MKAKILVCLFIGLLLVAAANTKTEKKKKDIEAEPEGIQILDNIKLDIEAKLSQKCNNEKKGKCQGEETASAKEGEKETKKKNEESGKEQKNKQSK